MTTAYENVILSLAENKMRLAISQQTLEDLLTVELGITQTKTMARHVALMIRLGYIRVARRGIGKEQMSYDLIGKRITEIRKARLVDEAYKDDAKVVPRR